VSIAELSDDSHESDDNIDLEQEILVVDDQSVNL